MPKLLRNLLAVVAGIAIGGGVNMALILAASHRVPIAVAIGVVFLAGGVAASFMIPAPAWFIALDLLAAYLPIAWLGTRVGARVAR